MIATLSGKVSQLLPTSVIIEIAGVGYEVRMPVRDLAKLKTEKPARLFIYEHIREESHDLYGFAEPETKALFEQLVGVSGVGPKMALAILSSVDADTVRAAIANEGVEVLQSVPGVGARTAARIIIELRNKALGDVRGLGTGADITYEALRRLGYSASQARSAAASVPRTVTSDEERIKLALKELAK